MRSYPVAMLTPLHQQVIQHVNGLYDLAERAYRVNFPRPLVTFRKSGRNAGTAFLQQNRINFNRVLLEHNASGYFSDVIPHEVAHLLCYQLYGRVKPHGYEWQRMMRDTFQCQPQTRHCMDTAPLNLPTIDYRCLCTTHALSRIRHNKMQRKKAKYICRYCNAELRPAVVPSTLV